MNGPKTYALPPYTQLTHNEELEPPWTATFLRWERWTSRDGLPRFNDRLFPLYDATSNIHQSTGYAPVPGNSRPDRCMIAHPPCHPRYHQLVDAIDYYPDATFERTFTGCRCLVLTVSYVPPLDSTGAFGAACLPDGVLFGASCLAG